MSPTPPAWPAAVADLRHQLGPVDLLVNNAGILGPAGPLWELELDEWWTTMDVNVRGLVLATQLVLPDMVAAGRGRIINITSQAGVHRWPLASAYSVSKAAVVKLTENLALETRRHGVERLQRPPRAAPHRDLGDDRGPDPDQPAPGTHPGLGAERARRRSRSRPGPGRRPAVADRGR